MARKIGLNEPFLAKVAEVVIDNYGCFFPELAKNSATILTNLTREEERFQRTVEGGMGQLNELLEELRKQGKDTLDGRKAFDLYATHGLPFELTRDVAQEQGLEVDEAGFRAAMDEHRLASGAGKAFGPMGGEDVDVYRAVLEDLQSRRQDRSAGRRVRSVCRHRDRRRTAGDCLERGFRCKKRRKAIRSS